jgi:hypothetical protein
VIAHLFGELEGKVAGVAPVEAGLSAVFYRVAISSAKSSSSMTRPRSTLGHSLPMTARMLICAILISFLHQDMLVLRTPAYVRG